MIAHRNLFRGALVLALCLTLACIASAQPMSLETPSDSPLWWSLSPDLTAEELRAAYLDPQGSATRYREAVEAGLEPRLTEEEMKGLLWYDNPALTPELMPMWLAFNTFANDYLEVDGRQAMDSQLEAYSLPARTRQVILNAAARLAKDEAEAKAEVGPKQAELILLQRKALEQGHPKSSVDQAARMRDKQFFSLVSGESPDQVDSLLAVYFTNPPAEASEKALRWMRERLSDEEWDLLRVYLLEAIVPGIGPAEDFK